MELAQTQLHEELRRVRCLRESRGNIREKSTSLQEPGAGKKEKGLENLLEMMAENSPNPGKETDIQVQGSWKVSDTRNPSPKRHTHQDTS